MQLRSNARRQIGRGAALLLMTVVFTACEPPPKPAIPISVSYRASSVGEGLVAAFRNTSDRYLTISLKVENPTLFEQKSFTLTFNPHTSQEFGWLEGWQFASGDRMTLRHNDYSVAELSVP